MQRVANPRPRGAARGDGARGETMVGARGDGAAAVVGWNGGVRAVKGIGVGRAGASGARGRNGLI